MEKISRNYPSRFFLPPSPTSIYHNPFESVDFEQKKAIRKWDYRDVKRGKWFEGCKNIKVIYWLFSFSLSLSTFLQFNLIFITKNSCNYKLFEWLKLMFYIPFILEIDRWLDLKYSWRNFSPFYFFLFFLFNFNWQIHP